MVSKQKIETKTERLWKLHMNVYLSALIVLEVGNPLHNKKHHHDFHHTGLNNYVVAKIILTSPSRPI